MYNLPYTKEELYSMGQQRAFDGSASAAAFLLGGIGTGNVSVGARGELKDWEIFNRPGKGNQLPYTFFAIRAREEGKNAVAKVIESSIQPPYTKPIGFRSAELAGLPRLKKSSMKGEYPYVWVDFNDDELPVEISLEAFTPFIPLNPEDSGIPCCILRYKVKNKSSNEVDVSITGSLANAVGFSGQNEWGKLKEDCFDGNVNEFRQDIDVAGLYMYSDRFKEGSIYYGSMGLVTAEEKVTVKPYWLEGGWCDGVQDFWDDFCEDGLLSSDSVNESRGNLLNTSKIKIGSLGIPFKLRPGCEKVCTFIITWCFPNRAGSWDEDTPVSDTLPLVRNHYYKSFKNAWEVGKYVIDNFHRLEGYSKKFHNALFESTLPDYVLDAVSSNITVLRSPTCFWIDNGNFLGWEGCGDKKGSCEGNCTHVWNYAQTLAFLFPSLERSMRNIEFNSETDEQGKMAFRTHTVFNQPVWDFKPAADGQLGTIIRLYREWKISGDNSFLKNMWGGAKRALDFAFSYWDTDGDFVLDGEQHNTYDIEFYGSNSMVNSILLGALKAGREMALAMGDDESAERYKKALELGSKRMDELLWDNEYYIQKTDDINKYKYQYGKGCLSDQLLGQLLCHTVGLGYILPKEHVKKAVESVFRYNFLTDFSHHHNVQRTYVLNDEKGLVLCSWPREGRPTLPFVYSDEVWTGVEYQVAAHLIYEGFIEEGLTVVKAVRERHDGYKRNPWNEVECGYHYVRSMSSWTLLIALSGFKYDMVNKKIGFEPCINKKNFTTFWSTGTAWGTYTQKWNDNTDKMEYHIDVLYGSLQDIKIIIGGTELNQ